MKFSLFIFSFFSLVCHSLCQDDQNETLSGNSAAQELLNSSFFAEVLENAKNSESDAMGTQRAVDLDESIFESILL